MHNSIVEYLNETYEQYRYAHKLAKKSLSRARRKQEPLHPLVLDETVNIYDCSTEYLGEIDVPASLIVGTRTAARTIPMFVEIANAIKEYSPNAWVINYTNPMSLCVKTLYETFPEIKAFGCCHEVFNTQEMLASILSNELHEKIKRQDLYTNVIGINHFTWFTRASYKDIDIFPIYEAYIKKHFKEGYEFTSDN